MPHHHSESILNQYRTTKDRGLLSPNLTKPTPAALRDECLNVYREKGLAKSENVLRAFFGALKDGEDFAKAIQTCDIDKFRPLINFMNERISSTNNRNLELLIWLMPGEKTLPQTGLRKAKYSILYLGLPVLAGVGIYLLLTLVNKKQCMFWNGSEFELTDCRTQGDGISAIAADNFRLTNFKRVKRPDTLTADAIGKMWYAKIASDSINVYTSGGENPADHRKRLLKMSEYIFNKYIKKHRANFSTAPK